MASQTNPLRFTDLRGGSHIEPSVTSLMTVQTEEARRPPKVNDLYILSTFYDGQPQVIRRFVTLGTLADVHDPDRIGDQGVALARVAKAGMSDMLGAPDVSTVRINAATNSTSTVSAGATALLTLATGRYGNQSRRWRRKLTAGTTSGKKLVLRDDNPSRVFTFDDLGVVMTLHYIGNGNACTLTLRRAGGVITYTGQPLDENIFAANGVTFEFDDNGVLVDPTHVKVTIGIDQNATWANALAAIVANVPGVTGVQDTAAGTVTLSATEEGLALTLFPLGNGSATAAATGDAASLRTTVTGATDGSADLAIPLATPAFKTIAKVAAYLNEQVGYSAAISSAYSNNKFLATAGLDIVTAADIKTATLNLTAYTEVIADAVNSGTRGNVTCTIAARGEPDEDADWVYFTGGTTPIAVASDWEAALNLLGSQVQLGGNILLDTDDPAIFATAVQWIEDQRSLGKQWDVYAGAEPGLANGTDVSAYLAITGALDHTGVHLTLQRLGVFADDGSITYLHPVYMAAAIAGAASGNDPWNPLTNRRLRFAALAEDDSFDLPTREDLIGGGWIVCKREQDVLVICLNVTTSQDPDNRMPRIASEIGTVNRIDSDMRAAFLSDRGKWADTELVARAPGKMLQVLNTFRGAGAIVPGVDAYGNPVAAYELGDPPAEIFEGVMNLQYTVYIGGEVDHVSQRGDAEYVRLTAQLSPDNVQRMTTSVPIR